MKQLLVFAICLFLGHLTFSQANNTEAQRTVTLTIGAQGKTLEEARINGLRNAIEQVYGTFVSSSTTIVNDALVKDEIATVSSGNIEKYVIISSEKISTDEFYMTISVTVSISRLTSYVESKGVSAELKGSIFADNIKIKKLNEANELRSGIIISEAAKKLLIKSIDFNITAGEPTAGKDDNYLIPIAVDAKFNDNILSFNNYYQKSIKGLAMPTDEVNEYLKLNKSVFPLVYAAPDNFTFLKIYYDYSNIAEIEKLRENLFARNDLTFYLMYSNEENGILVETTQCVDFIAKLKILEKKRQLNSYNRPYIYISNSKLVPNLLFYRNEETRDLLANIINFSKVALTNFNVINGIDSILGVELLYNQVGWSSSKDNRSISKSKFQIAINPLFIDQGRGSFFNEITNDSHYTNYIYAPLGNDEYPRYGLQVSRQSLDNDQFKYLFPYMLLEEKWRSRDEDEPLRNANIKPARIITLTGFKTTELGYSIFRISYNSIYSLDKISQISKYAVSKLDFSHPVLSILLKHNSNMRMIRDKF